MATNPSLSTLFVLFNVLFYVPTRAQFGATSFDSATAQSPSPATVPQRMSPPAGVNCSQCDINPIGLASCGLLLNGVVTANTIGTCCRTLRPLTKAQGASCLCYAIKIKAIKIGSINVLDAVDQVLATCSKL